MQKLTIQIIFDEDCDQLNMDLVQGKLNEFFFDLEKLAWEFSVNTKWENL